MNAFEMITIPAREEKPRKTGLTTLLDRGIGYHAALDLTEQAADYIDLIKLGWGTSRLMPEETIKKKTIAKIFFSEFSGGFKYFLYFIRFGKTQNPFHVRTG